MRIGIFGGTFNPIHCGHLRMAECAAHEAELDLVYFLPTNIPPHKDSSLILDIKHREKMVRLAIKGNHFFALSRVESRSKAVTYTADTILKFKRKFTGSELFFITGEDTLEIFHKYRRYEEILGNAKLLIAPRPAPPARNAVSPQVLAASIFLKNYEQLDISSTKIRERIKSGYTVRYLVPEKVNEYIIKNGLYK